MPLSHGSGWSVFFPAWVRSCSSPGHDLGHSPSRFHGASSLHLDQRARWATGRVSSNETANTADAFTPHHLMGASPGTHLPAESPLLKELEYIAGWACSLGNALILDEGDTKKDDEADHFEKISPHWFITNRSHPACCHNGIDPPRPRRQVPYDRRGRPSSDNVDSQLRWLHCPGHSALLATSSGHSEYNSLGTDCVYSPHRHPVVPDRH